MQICSVVRRHILALALAVPLAAIAQTTLNPADIKWQNAPEGMPKGAKIAVMHGDPGKDGIFTIRLQLPSGARIEPHWHTGDEQLTVISGTFYLGYGQKMEIAKAHALKAGGFHFLPGKTTHFALAKGPVVIQVTGNGPFDMNHAH
jgi:uncharacterized RmlC-like cupin family protein